MTKRKKYSPDDAPLTPEMQNVLNRMDAGALLKGEWHTNAKYVWYLWDGDPESLDGANVRVVAESTVNRLLARKLIERHHRSTRESAYKCTTEGRRRARRADILREGGEWTVSRDSEHLYVDHKIPGEVFHEQWVFRWSNAGMDGKGRPRGTLVLVRGDQPTPDMAIRSAWQALHRTAESVDTFTRRKEIRAAATALAMASAEEGDPPPELDERERGLIGLGVTPARLEVYYAELRRRNAQRIIRNQDAL